MELRELAERVLFGSTLADKLATPDRLVDTRPGPAIDAPRWPARTEALRLDRDRPARPFPSVSELDDPDARAFVLHSFANHELLATELMALMLLRFPDAPRAFRLGLGQILCDEQEHMRLYLGRMEALGAGFGEHRVSPFFWNALAGVPDPMTFVVGMSLGFEQANLDHSLHWLAACRTIEDAATAEVLQQVYDDEVRHVRHGLHWFRRWRAPGEDDWDGFVARAKGPLSPARARGPGFSVAAREACGFDERFVRELAVWSNSRGRPPVVHHFNAGCEEEVAGRRPSRATLDLRHDLAVLPLVLAKADDVVVVPERPAADHLARLQAAGFELPELATSPPEDRPAQGHRFFGLVPGAPGWDEAHALWYRRSTATRHLQRLWSELDPELVGPPLPGRVVHSLAELREALGEHPRSVLKAELSSSGRGLRWVDELGPGDARWAEARLEADGALVVQPRLDPVCELSAVFEGGKARLSRSLTEGGRYRGSRVGWPLHGLPGEVHRLLDAGRAALRAFEALAVDLPLFGIDGLVHRRGGRLWLHPCLELNPRTTMGHYAVALGRRVKRGVPAVFRIVTSRDVGPLEAWAAQVPPPRLERGQLVDGTVVLNDPRVARRFLAVLEVAPISPDDLEK